MLDNILPLVKKPIRYTGAEYNITVKTNPEIKIGIIFPEIYEIGMSNLGIKILYSLFNNIKGVQCERIFAPWFDFGAQLLQKGLPLYSLETRSPLTDFDLLGFSLQSELSYTTVLYLFDLAQIPYLSSKRDNDAPLVIAGGPATLNPTPLADVFDCFVIGDGEVVVNDIVQILKCIPKTQRQARLEELAKLSGVWVPNIHGYKKRIKKCTIDSLDDETMPAPVIVPICEITHDRLAIEAMRGCTWGCRFCQAGYVNRPLRLRSEEQIIRAVEKGIRETGWEEVSLLSFSILDYPNLLNLIRRLNEVLKKKMISISLPAMRGELFTEDLGLLLREIKKTGLTFAPETASEKLRYKLNKPFSNERLISSINTAYRLGWKQVKLYMMIGLPFEKESDIKETEKLMDQILKAYPKGNIKLSINSFIPKPHTPFEQVEFNAIEELNYKINQIKKMKKRRLEIKYQAPEVSFIEALLSRGDEKLFPVIEEVYKQGAKFEEWREGFDFSKWQNACDKYGISPKHYFEQKGKYPWDFIDVGVTKDFLKDEFERAQQALVTENCFYEKCTSCGACAGDMTRHFEHKEVYQKYGRYPKRRMNPSIYRVKYSIGEPFRYASHLDITRTIYRSLRRSNLPIQFTQGFSPIPRVSFCPPKSVGQITKGDFFDFYLEKEYFGNISLELNKSFPNGIRVLEVRALAPGTPSLSSSINLIYYEIEIPKNVIKKSFDFTEEKPIYVKTKSGPKNLNESLASISYEDNILTCGLYFGGKKVNIYELISFLTDLPLEMSRTYKITRTTMFIKKEGILYAPMEVK